VIPVLLNVESCLRLVRALTVEKDENWLEPTRHVNMELLIEQKEEAPGKVDEAAHGGGT
jgi:hypothetical protein